jgi:hypothetical protein
MQPCLPWTRIVLRALLDLYVIHSISKFSLRIALATSLNSNAHAAPSVAKTMMQSATRISFW